MLAAVLVLWSPAAVFDVTRYGAVGDGTTYDTAAVRKAAAAATAADGGTLLFPSPKTFLTGAFNVTSHTHVEIAAGATVLGSTRGEDWPLLDARVVWPQFGHGSDCKPGTESCRLMHQALIFAWNAENVSMGGGGAFDCNSQKDTWWRCAKNLSLPPCNGYGRAHCMMFANATDVEVSHLHVSNSPDWTMHFSSCTRLRVHHNNVSNPLEPNADGIDIDATQDALIEDNYFNVGDDALCVKSGIDWFGRQYARPAKNIMFRRNTIGTGHGITIGSEMSGGVSNVTFEDITMDKTGTGVRLKSQRGRGGTVENITYRRILMNDIEGDCIQINLNYHKGIKPTNASATPKFRNILLEDILCKKGGSSYLVDGLAEQHIENLIFRNVSLPPGKKNSCDFAQCTCDTLTSPCPSCCKPALKTTDPMVIFAAGTTVPGAAGAPFRNESIQFEGFRIPSILRLKNGSLYASAEGRFGKDSSGAKYPSALVSRVSLDKAGTKWSDIRIVHAEVGVVIGNALPIADLETGKLFLFFCRKNKDIFLKTSTSGGTWSAPRNMSSVLKPGPAGDSASSPWIGAGPSAGVQVPATGRLLGAVNSKVASKACRPCPPPPRKGWPLCGLCDVEYAISSDDHGATWRRSSPVPTGASSGLGEASLTLAPFLGKQGIAMLIRASTLHKPHTTHMATMSTDNGETWAAATRAFGLNHPSCSDSVLELGNGILVGVAPFGRSSDPVNHPSRQNLTLWTAAKGGVNTWTATQTVYPFCSAYSSMAKGLGPNDAIVEFEGVFGSGASKADCLKNGGAEGKPTDVPYSIAVLPLDIEPGADGPPPPPPAERGHVVNEDT